MIDEPLPATDGTDTEPRPTERDESAPDRGANCDATDPASEPVATDRDPREEPDRATDPPPDRHGGDAAGEPDREPDGEGDEADEPDGEGDEADEPDAYEYRLERLRLWRTVVTLAVVVARLVRSL